MKGKIHISGLIPIENVIKAHAIVTPNLKDNRPMLNYISVEGKPDDSNVRLVSTNGHMILTSKNVEWELLRNYYEYKLRILLPERFVPGLLPSSETHLNTIGKYVYEDSPVNDYPKWRNVIPEKFECDFMEYPIISSLAICEVQSVCKHLGIGQVTKLMCWTSKHSVAFFNLNNEMCETICGVMPVVDDERRLGKESITLNLD
jgi:hypothetical protein